MKEEKYILQRLNWIRHNANALEEICIGIHNDDNLRKKGEALNSFLEEIKERVDNVNEYISELSSL